MQKNKMPTYVVDWTDKYFHQSAFDIPLKFPSKKVINFLIKFRKEEKIKLYRGINRYNKNNYTGIKSWTYVKKIASLYAKEINGRVVEKVFQPKNILLDTTLLDEQSKLLLGYDHKFNDKEVLTII
ncbi:MAG: hypothetical protein WC768_03570 [Patescibacteria group bacterium]|jgi:hypothetical protein